MHLLPALLLALALAVTSCRHAADVPSAKLAPPPVSEAAWALHKTEVERLKGRLSESYVFIDGEDIQLPLTAGPSAPQENRVYSFYVWAYDAELSRKPLMEMLGKEFSLEVVGAKARFVLPNYLPPDQATRYKRLFPATDDWFLQSRDVIEVQVDSKDLQRSFSIVAWFPQKWAQHEAARSRADRPGRETGQTGRANGGDDTDAGTTNAPPPNAPPKNPFGFRKDVRVFNGDLRTTIQIISPEEVSASLGRHFHKYFYVGRVYFRNRHPDKRLVVYTTSMKANVLMYRKRLEGKKQRALSPGELAQIRSWQTNSVPRVIPEALAGTCVAAALSTDLPDLSLRQAASSNLLESIWRDTNRIAQATQEARDSSSQELRVRCMDLINHVFELVEEESTALTRDQQEQRRAAGQALTEAETVLGRVLGREPSMATGSNYLFFKTNFAVLKEASRGPGLEAASRANTLEELLKRAETWGEIETLERRELRRAIATARAALDGVARLSWLQWQLTKPLAGWESKGQSRSSPRTPEWEQELVNRRARIRLSAVAIPGQSTPLDKELDIAVTPENRALAFSRDADLQLKLSEEGMLWRDLYRPMSFQAVLNALIFVHERSWESRTVKFLESAARVAGGISAMGTIFNELTTQGYVEAVNIFSTLLLPEVKSLLLEDLNKHIRNLGELSMDTVMVIPPNEAVDRYVFFPRGPIFNFVDEFNISDPGYIVRIDSSDVSAEAMVIDQDTPIQTGELTGQALVGRALNEGKASETAEVLKQAALQDKVRRFDLMSLATSLDSLLGGESVAGEDGVKTDERRKKEAEALRMVRDFEARNGQDKTGLISNLLRKYSVDYYDAPPTLGALDPVRLPAGFTSHPIALPICDDRTALHHLLVNVVTNSEPTLVPTDGITWDYPRRGEDRPIRLTVATRKELRANESTRVVLRLQAEDEAGGKTQRDLEVIVQPRTESILLDNLAPTNGSFTIANPGIHTLRLAVPLRDASPDNVTLTGVPVGAVMLIDGRTNAPVRIQMDGRGATLTGEWRIDASQLNRTNRTADEIKVTLSVMNDPVMETNLTLKAKSP